MQGEFAGAEPPALVGKEDLAKLELALRGFVKGAGSIDKKRLPFRLLNIVHGVACGHDKAELATGKGSDSHRCNTPCFE
jgi:hypothetical protein